MYKTKPFETLEATLIAICCNKVVLPELALLAIPKVFPGIKSKSSNQGI